MYTIGELSKIVKLSIDALRHYDEIGLLKPHHIDPVSRYRYYSSSQVSEIIAIMEWKQYGFSLDAIAELIKCTDTVHLRKACEAKIGQLLIERRDIEHSIELLQKRIHRLNGGSALEKKTVLIVDDTAFIRQIIGEMLEKQGLTVVGSAADGETGIQMYSELKPDLVILDIGMPGMDGLEVLRRIKKTDSRASVVMCSAKGQPSTVLESLKEGADNFVVKPFLPERLLEAVFNNEAIGFQQGTITAILSDSRIPRMKQPLSQDSIKDLLDLCRGQYETDALELNEFRSKLSRLDEPAFEH